MSLAKILAARKRKRNFYDGGDADPEGNADASRPDGSPSVGGFNGGPEPGQAPGTVNPDAFTPSGGSGPKPGEASTGTTNTGGDSQAGGNGAQQGPTGPSTGGSTDGFTGSDAPGVNTGTPSVSPNAPEPGSFAAQLAEMLTGGGSKLANMPGTVGVLGQLANLAGRGITAAYDANSFMGRGSGINSNAPSNGYDVRGDYPTGNPSTTPFGSSTPTQTTPATPTDAGMRRYVWDPVARQYTLTNVGGGANPMGYTAGQTFRMAAGGAAPAGLAAARTQPRFVQGGGTGLSDDVPVRMDDGGEGRLADGEFVIPADVVSGLGGGSSKAGADMLYQMMERIRQAAHGKSQQIRPVDPSRVLPV